VPSDFFNDGIFGTSASIPTLPLKKIDEIPLLFGQPEIKRDRDTLVVYADIIASAFFLCSRYEERVNIADRDEHGRFKGTDSLPFRAGFIHRPLVDEYGKLLRKWLRISGVELPEEKNGFSGINLTHDIDEPFYCRTWRNVAGRVLRGNKPIELLKYKFGELEDDLFYTFPYITELDKSVIKRFDSDICRSIYFIKSGGKTKQDRPHYNLNSIDIQYLVSSLLQSGADIGLHTSYEASENLSLAKKEKTCLEDATHLTIRANRYHFLSTRKPEDMDSIVDAGLTDDYSLGYADVAGFRLGTAHPVKYINPYNLKISDLTLHPLTIMDCTLNDSKYMKLEESEAEEYCFKLMDSIRNVNGELTLLWHNTSFAGNNDSYLKNLYIKILNSI